MAIFLTREQFEAPGGRKRAWRSLMLEDHGFLRKLYNNTHRLGPDAFRTYQPSPADIQRWAKRGIRTIINLRGLRNHEAQPGFYWLEEEAARQHGIVLLNMRAYSREAPKRDFLLALDRAFETAAYPILLHCKSGADRAGLGSALYAFLRLRQPLPEALSQMDYRYGHVKAGKTGVLDHFFATYAAAAAAASVTPNRAHFLEWAARDYDPDTVNHSFRAGAVGTFITDRVLRRE